MKGIIFNLMEEVVTTSHGPDAWDSLLDAAKLEGAYTSLGNYPDQAMQALVAAAAQSLGITPFEVLRWFGNEAMPLLFVRYPGFFSPHKSTRSFVLTVNSMIHPEVRKIYPGAECPDFEFSDAPDGSLLMGYQSPRRLCALAQGFVEGAAAHYGEEIVFEHQQCMHNGDQACLCRISFPSEQRG